MGADTVHILKSRVHVDHQRLEQDTASHAPNAHAVARKPKFAGKPNGLASAILKKSRSCFP